MIKKECGTCTLCCDLFPVKWLNKSEDTKCIHCDLGCKIQATKDDECREFDCEYILDDTMNIELRPDNCDVLFEKITTRIYLALAKSDNSNAWKEKNVMVHINKLNKKGISVITSSYTDTPKEIFLADGHTKEKVWSIAVNLVNR